MYTADVLKPSTFIHVFSQNIFAQAFDVPGTVLAPALRVGEVW